MIIPVRCFSCGKVVASDYRIVVERTRAGENADAVLDDLGVTRYCCRRMILSAADLIEEILPFR